MKIVSLLSLIVFVSCTSYQLTDQGREVNVKEKNKVEKCETVGKVVGHHAEGALELAKNSARNEAGKLGADSIVFEEIISNGKERIVHGMAYRCSR